MKSTTIHGKCKEITIALTEEEKMVQVKMSDDGKSSSFILGIKKAV